MGGNINELYQGAQALEKQLGKLPTLQDVTSDLQIKSPQLSVLIAFASLVL